MAFKFDEKIQKALATKAPVKELPETQSSKGSQWTTFLLALEPMVPITAADLGVSDWAIKNAFGDHKKKDPSFKYATRKVDGVLTFFKVAGEKTVVA